MSIIVTIYPLNLFQTLGLGSDGDHGYLWKCSTVVGGIYFFFITENLMKIYIRFSEWKVSVFLCKHFCLMQLQPDCIVTKAFFMLHSVSHS